MALATLVAACDPGAERLLVDLRTDFIPGVEFDEVVVDVVGADASWEERTPVTTEAPFETGVRVADVDGVTGTVSLEVAVHRAGDQVAAARLSVEVMGVTAQTVDIDRFGGELRRGEVIELSSSGVEATQPAILADGDRFAIAFEMEFGPEIDIGLVHADLDLVPLGPAVNVSQSAGPSAAPALVAGGPGYGIAWVELTPEPHLVFAVFDRAGARISEPVDLGATDPPSRAPAVLFVEDHFLVMHEAYDAGYIDQLHVARLSADGTLLSNVQLTDARSDQEKPDVAWSGTRLGLAWEAEDASRVDHVMFMLLAPDGRAASEPIAVSEPGTGEAERPIVTWTGQEFVVVWEDERVAGRDQLYLRRVDSMGATLGEEVVLTGPLTENQRPDVVFTRTNLAIAAETCCDPSMAVSVTRFSSTGQSATEPVTVSTDGSEPAQRPRLAVIDEHLGIVWSHESASTVAVHGLALSAPR